MDLITLFKYAMKRTIQPFHDWREPILNLGPGNAHIPGTLELDWPAWNGETDRMPYEDATIGTGVGFHFLEHLTTPGVVHVLRETERVLRVGGHAVFMVPHASCMMAYQDLDHKSWWTEDSMALLLENTYYQKMRMAPWALRVTSTVMMGITARNLALFFQLEKQS